MIRTTHLPKLIFIQGPPGSGKDTVAHLLRDFGSYTPFKFAQPIIDAMRAQFQPFFQPSGRPNRTLSEFKKHDFGPYLGGEKVTGRDIMIAWSENFMKPLFGQEVFGRLASWRAFPLNEDRQADPFYRAVFSDSGFEAESFNLLGYVTPKNAVIIQLYRPTFTFAGDSRNYWANHEVATFSYNNALEDLDAMQLDFIKWFNTNVFTFADQQILRSKANA